MAKVETLKHKPNGEIIYPRVLWECVYIEGSNLKEYLESMREDDEKFDERLKKIENLMGIKHRYYACASRLFIDGEPYLHNISKIAVAEGMSVELKEGDKLLAEDKTVVFTATKSDPVYVADVAKSLYVATPDENPTVTPPLVQTVEIITKPKGEGGGGGTVEIDGTTIVYNAAGELSVNCDTALSSTSTNPVQNKVITAELETVVHFTEAGTTIPSVDVTHADRATADDDGNAIKTTYLKDAPSDGKSYTRKDGAWSEIEPVTLDTALSATSTNGVQNKAITNTIGDLNSLSTQVKTNLVAAINDVASKEIVLDTSLSETSTNGVQNKVITAEIGKKQDVDNLVTAWCAAPEDTHYPSEKLVKGELDDKFDKASAVGTVLEFNATTSYKVGDLCFKDGVLYRCIEDYTGAWDATKFEAYVMKADLDIAKKEADDLTNTILDLAMKGGNFEMLLSQIMNKKHEGEQSMIVKYKKGVTPSKTGWDAVLTKEYGSYNVWTLTHTGAAVTSYNAFWKDDTNLLGVMYMPITDSVTDMGSMFRGCTKLTEVYSSSWDTSSVTNINCMFYGCSSLTTLDVSNWDTSSVTNMGSMFLSCSSLTTLDVSNWDTSSVTNMYESFANCSNLVTLDVSNWDTSSVTNTKSMFDTCSKLTTLDVSNWNTSRNTTMSMMFKGCSSLTSVDVSNWDTSSMTSMGYAFYGCSKLTSLDLSKFNTAKVTNNGEMFSGCTKITTITTSKDFWRTAQAIKLSPMTALTKTSFGDMAAKAKEAYDEGIAGKGDGTVTEHREIVASTTQKGWTTECAVFTSADYTIT